MSVKPTVYILKNDPVTLINQEINMKKLYVTREVFKILHQRATAREMSVADYVGLLALLPID